MNEMDNKGKGENRRPDVKALIFVHDDLIWHKT
jgi:hypothetical protein